ncbi:restriction endonuclease subunit S [Holzapfeliella sp. JNUCC 80]
MSNKTRVPKLRFKGFQDEWEEVKVEALANNFIGGGTPKTKDKTYWTNGTIPWIQSSDLEQDDVININLKKHITQNAVNESSAKLVPSESIAIVSRVGVGKLAYIPYEYSTSQDFLSLSELNYNPYFVTYSLYKIMNIVKNHLQGTSIKGVTKKELLSNKVIVTNDVKEQEKIGKFFAKLDKLIELNSKKLRLKQELNEVLTQKMFVDYHDVNLKPLMRFSQFEDDWHSTYFKCIFDYERPDKYIVEDDNYSDDGTPVLTANKSFVLGYTKEKNIYGRGNSIVFDDFTLDNKFVNFDYKVKSSAIKILTAKENFDLFFAYKRLNSEKILKEGHARHYISIVQNTKTKVPRLIEQQKIGQLFSSIDQEINLYQQKVDNLKQLKKAYLQKMFC